MRTAPRRGVASGCCPSRSTRSATACRTRARRSPGRNAAPASSAANGTATRRGSDSDRRGCRRTCGYGRSACATDGAQPVICSTHPAYGQRHAVEAGHARLELVVQLAAHRQVRRIDRVVGIDARRQASSRRAHVGDAQRQAVAQLPLDRDVPLVRVGPFVGVQRAIRDALAVQISPSGCSEES